ncbi:MAG: 3-dehydroquinate synthase [Candidatus Omnitrophota bacterium]
MSAKKITVNLFERSYPIIIQKNGFQHLGRLLKKMQLGNAACIITNSRVQALYGKELALSLTRNGIATSFIRIADSEKSKSAKVYFDTVTKISKIDTKKRLFLIAFGGGVAGDLCGFIAATYKRGINYIQVPTTLLAQVDSAIGGKTAIDLASGKNLLGAFCQPRLVYSNLSLLQSLPKRQIRSGIAEIVKYGVISDKKLFGYIEKNYKKILKLDPNALLYLVASASRIKADVVSRDERETLGLRAVLNFGHTIGHALETATKYNKLNHGEAVSIGMTAAAQIARQMGILKQETFLRIEQLLKHMDLPVKTKNSNFRAVLKAFYRDKKFIRGKVRMVLPTRLGHVIVTEDIPLNLIKTVIKNRVVS